MMSSTEDLELINNTIHKFFYDLIYVPDLELNLTRMDNEGILYQPKVFSAEHYPKLFLNKIEKNISLSIVFETKKNLISLKNYLFENKLSELITLIKRLDDDAYTRLCSIKDTINQQTVNELRCYKSNRLDILTIKRLIASFDRLIDIINSNVSDINHIHFYFVELIININDIEIEEKITRIKNIYSFLLTIKPTLSKEEERNNYATFIKILNEVRHKDLISAKQRRNYDREWRNNIGKRIDIMNDLKTLLNI